MAAKSFSLERLVGRSAHAVATIGNAVGKTSMLMYFALGPVQKSCKTAYNRLRAC